MFMESGDVNKYRWVNVEMVGTLSFFNIKVVIDAINIRVDDHFY